ncbi:glycosyltransferase [Candidatus Omnitrophota bacterium]
MNKLVSIILPAFNSARYINEAITSVLAQDYGQWELLVIDDGSTDATGDIVQRINDTRIRYIKVEHMGNYCARNTGICRAQGEYIAFLDSDDIWLKNKLSAQVDILNSDESIGICCSEYYVVFNDDKEQLFVNPQHSFSEHLLTQGVFIKRLLFDNFILTSSAMVRKKCIDRIGVFDTTFKNAMDYDMWLRLALNYKAHYLEGKYVMKRVHPGNISRDRVTSLKALLYIFKNFDAYVTGTDFFNEEYLQIIRRKIQKTMYHLGLAYLSARDFKNALKYLRNCEYAPRSIFRVFARMVARLRIGFLIVLIDTYRARRQKDSLIVAQTGKEE